jgi:hypothetical protein
MLSDYTFIDVKACEYEFGPPYLKFVRNKPSRENKLAIGLWFKLPESIQAIAPGPTT